MILAITLTALFIIGLLVYTIFAVRDIWSQQDEAYAAILPALKDTHSKLKAANDQTEKKVREYFAENGIPFPDNHTA
jgi:hypothetical protein